VAITLVLPYTVRDILLLNSYKVKFEKTKISVGFRLGLKTASSPMTQDLALYCYLPTMCSGSLLFSSQMLSMRSVSGTRRQLSLTDQGLV
jgi:hypothetical protein